MIGDAGSGSSTTPISLLFAVEDDELKKPVFSTSSFAKENDDIISVKATINFFFSFFRLLAPSPEPPVFPDLKFNCCRRLF